MVEFLDAADAIRGEKEAQVHKQHFDLVFRAIAELDRVHAKATLDIRNLESVFGAFEMAAMCGTLGNLTPEELQMLGPAIRWVIVRTLELRIKFPIVHRAVLAPPPYGDFVRLVAHMKEAGLGPVSFITMNYDLSLDYALHRRDQEIDYCLEAGATGGMEVMKLHGSLNWARCARCKKVIPWHLREYFQKYNWQDAILYEAKWGSLEIASRVAELQHCGEPCTPEPVIVPPTWNKAQYQDLVTVWRRAAHHLSEAENIVVIGYSLPNTDEFFRYLYALGTVGPARLKRFDVVNPDNAVAGQFERLLGPVAKDRFRIIRHKFDGAIRELASELNVQIEREVQA